MIAAKPSTGEVARRSRRPLPETALSPPRAHAPARTLQSNGSRARVPMMRVTRPVTLAAASTAVILLAIPGRAEHKPVELIRAPSTPPVERRLEVRIVPFLEASDFVREVRRAEARYIAFRLRNTLDESGHWGPIRVVPRSVGSEVTIRGEVLSSTGERLELRVQAEDATGKVWLDKKFRGDSDANRLSRSGHGRRPVPVDPQQDRERALQEASEARRAAPRTDPRDRIAPLRGGPRAPTPFAST